MNTLKIQLPQQQLQQQQQSYCHQKTKHQKVQQQLTEPKNEKRSIRAGHLQISVTKNDLYNFFRITVNKIILRKMQKLNFLYANKKQTNKQKKAIGARFRMYLAFECSMCIQKEMNLMG